MKESIDQIVSLVNEVEEGNTDALKAFIALKELEKVLTAAMSQIKDGAVSEAKKYNAKSFELMGCRIDVKEGTARWSYKHIPQWSRHQEEMKKIEEAAKLRYKNPTTLMADADGEEILPALASYDKESIAITLPKL